MENLELPIKESNKFIISTSKFRILFYITGLIIVGIIAFNFYRNATTVFSGTHYMSLPSNFYITSDIDSYKLPDTNSQSNEKFREIIPVGSFLLDINGIKFKSNEDFISFFSKIKPDSIIIIRVFDVKKSKFLVDMDPKTRFFKLSGIYEIKKKNISENTFKYLNGPIFMGFIGEDGATDRAGIKSGDVLLNINGKELSMVSKGEYSEGLTPESLAYLRSFKSGEPVYYNILRNNKEMKIEVRLAVFGIPLEFLFLLIVGLPCLITGMFFLIKRPDNISARFVGYMMIILGFQILSSPSLYYPEFDIFSYLKIYVNNLANIIFMPVLLHSFYYFPEPVALNLRKKYYIAVPYLLSMVSVLLFSYWYFTDYTKIIEYVLEFPIIASLLFFVVLQIINRKFTTKEYRRKSRAVKITFTIVLLIIYIPIISRLFGIKIPLYQYSYMIFIITPFVYLFVVKKYKLFDIGLKIRRNIQYLFISYLWKGIILIAFLYVLSLFSKINVQFPNVNMVLLGSKIEVLSVPLDEMTNAFYNKIFFLVISFTTGFALYKMGMSGIRFFDRKYYRQKFDYRHAQNELIKLIGSKFTIESLARIIIEKISVLVRVKRSGAIFFKDEKEIWGDKSYCYDSIIHTDYCFDSDEKIIGLLKQFKKPFPVEYLAGKFKNTLIEQGFKYVVPFKSNDKILGALFIGEKQSETNLNQEDIDFLESIVSSASVAVENAFLYEDLTEQERYKQELEIAHRIQMASLPQKVPSVKGLDISATSLPALEVGGDFYDFLNGHDGKITVVVGDVSGKGTSAALYMSKIQGILQTLNEFIPSPDQLLVRANKLIYKNIDSKSFITAVGASFDTGRNELSLARAGHLPIYFLRNSNNKVNKVQPGGIGIGLSGEDVFNENLEHKKINFERGDIFLFVSDGITESNNRTGEQYGEERLIDFIEKNSCLSSKQICDGIIASVKQFSDEARQFDDMTVVVVKAE